MNNRDPRIDPRPGDVIFNGTHHFYITGFRDGTVFYSDTAPLDIMSIPISEWRYWSKNDVVISLGDS